jgi:hypothetical protein
MAGGVHVHFSMQIDGVQVNPRAWWEAHGTPRAATAPLREWVARPSRWPAPGGAANEVRDDRLLRLQAELDHIRGSRTFRGLRLLDRWLGRGR